jgi:flap endonuclease-1
MQYNIKFIFVFDGKAPELKLKERERRSALKHEAELKLEKATEEENLEDMKKYASRTSKLTKEMISDVKELIEALGCPVVQAPSEGEAQAAILVKNKDAYASLSQDADSLLFGCPLVVKNLTLSGRKKLPNKLSYDAITPELISLKDQLIALSMLIGTDYNIGGIKGIGPKTALKLVKEHGSGMANFDKLFEEAEWDKYFDYDWKDVFNIIKHTETTSDYKLTFKDVDDEKVVDVLCNKHDFNEERTRAVLEKLHKRPVAQKGLGEYF